MAVILWGKPIIKINTVTGTSANLDVATPVADSTQLSTEAGDKHTADIEGGGYEALRYDRGSFTLEFSVRFAKDRTMPFADVSHDGQITGTYGFTVSSEEAGAPVMILNEANVRYEDEYSADDGARRHYFAETIVPSGGGDQITWGQAPVASPASLEFEKTAGSKTVTITSNDTLTASNVSIPAGASWLTVSSVAGNVITLAASANSASSAPARNTTVTVSDSAGSVAIAVSQAANA